MEYCDSRLYVNLNLKNLNTSLKAKFVISIFCKNEEMDTHEKIRNFIFEFLGLQFKFKKFIVMSVPPTFRYKPAASKASVKCLNNMKISVSKQ